MKYYESEKKENKKATFTVKAKSLKDAKDSAYWMLHTKTNPPVKANYKYKIKGDFYGLSKSN